MPDNPAPSEVKAFFTAIENDDIATMQSLLDAHQAVLTSTNDYYNHSPLHHAVYWGKKAAAEFLLAQGIDPNIRGEQGRTPLHGFHYARTAEVVALLLARGADANAKDHSGKTPIFFAHTKEIAELLVAHGAIVNTALPAKRGFAERRGWTPLHAAACNGNAELIEYLISQGANVNARTADKQTPLGSAGETATAAALLAHGADPNTKDHLGWTPLAWAAWGGHVERLKLLLAFGGKVQGAPENTPLHIAASSHQKPAVECLLDQGWNVNAAEKDGCTPLHYVIPSLELKPNRRTFEQQQDAANVMTLLLDRGANINAQNSQGHTPLHLALLQQAPLLVELLIARGAHVDIFAAAALHDSMPQQMWHFNFSTLGATTASDTEGNSALHWAAISNQSGTARVLLQNGANVNAPNLLGQTPLQLAAQYGHLDVARVLVEQRASIDTADAENMTPFMAAAWSNQEEMLMLLAMHGANVNQRDKDAWTALHYSAWCGAGVTVAVLLALSADPNLLDTKGRTPLDVALCEHHTDIVALLQKHHAQRARHLQKNRRKPRSQ